MERGFSELAKRFYSARRIVVFAGDAAGILAEYLEYQINVLGLPIFAATSAGAITHLARAVSKRDLVIAISFRRGLRQTIEGAQQARTHGAYCVGISDTYISPLARECHEVFLASVEATSFGISLAAPARAARCHHRSMWPAPPTTPLSLGKSPRSSARDSAGTTLSRQPIAL